MKGCERRGIQDEVERGSETNLDPFNDIDPTEQIQQVLDNECKTPINLVDKKYTCCNVYDKDG